MFTECDGIESSPNLALLKITKPPVNNANDVYHASRLSPFIINWLRWVAGEHFLSFERDTFSRVTTGKVRPIFSS